ncbi:hypothetical protein HMPREF1097_02681 [Enterocloster bolteae 90B8]|uniref:Uncharacterized protein n=2 Tax=Enterocloster bolteae TaxID=208479 RepID=A0A414AT02_9FIRM|nr:hypothetical protein HMPREF1097_02681 [Enterocloster bolteae 90B8]RGO78047.1 hypothetical protein DXB04_27495 [Enterocloster bolteae]RHC54631.1 hypothetical protein DW839_18200 [Enterocloster bolteae]
MTDNELLLALSDMLETKLQPIKDDIQCLYKLISQTEREINCIVRLMDLSSKVNELEKKVNDLK